MAADGLSLSLILLTAFLGIMAVVFIGMLFFGEPAAEESAEPVETPSGFPVPPMPAGGPVRGSAAPLTFDDNRVEADR